MRRSFGMALALGLAALAGTAVAQTAAQDARVTNLDRAHKAFFSAQWYSGSANYFTTPRTTYRVGNQPTSFDYIKTGTMVRVSSHMEGDKVVADDVMIVQ